MSERSLVSFKFINYLKHVQYSSTLKSITQHVVLLSKKHIPNQQTTHCK